MKINEKNRKKFFTVIYSYNIFQYISRYVFEKKYFNFFKYKKCERNEILVKENEKNENMFFIINGEFELSISRNIVEVNNLVNVANARFFIDSLSTNNSIANIFIKSLGVQDGLS